MKLIKWGIGIVFAMVILSGLYDLLKPEGMKEYKYNLDLETIKKDWRGNLVIDGEYTNGIMHKDKQIMPIDILKWKLTRNPQAEERKNDTFELNVVKDNSFVNSENDMIVWLGHASFFIRINNTTFITDPIFYDITFIKRLTGLPCNVSDLKNIDYILLSHGHRDHFDKKSLKELFSINPNIEA